MTPTSVARARQPSDAPPPYRSLSDRRENSASSPLRILFVRQATFCGAIGNACSNALTKAIGDNVAGPTPLPLLSSWYSSGRSPAHCFSSYTWQLVINTGTTIVTFLMVFLIQNTQNRDTEALQLKIDELIRVTEQARNRLINLEDLTEEEMDKVKRELADVARADRGDSDTSPESV
jgi:low affinity Fe/Cu permease